jgi:hypothetical protein
MIFLGLSEPPENRTQRNPVESLGAAVSKGGVKQQNRRPIDQKRKSPQTELMKWFLLVVLIAPISCSTYKKDEVKGCMNYEPVCIFSSTKRECSINSDGCRSCSCVPQNAEPPNPGKAW